MHCVYVPGPLSSSYAVAEKKGSIAAAIASFTLAAERVTDPRTPARRSLTRAVALLFVSLRERSSTTANPPGDCLVPEHSPGAVLHHPRLSPTGAAAARLPGGITTRVCLLPEQPQCACLVTRAVPQQSRTYLSHVVLETTPELHRTPWPV